MCQIEHLLPAAGCMLAARVPAVLSPSEAVTLYGFSCSSCPCGSSGHDSSQQPGRRPSHDCARRANYSQIQQSLMQAISFRRGTLLTWMPCWCRQTHCWLEQTQHTRRSGMCKSRPRWTPPWGDTQLTGTPPWSAMCAQPPVCPRSKQQLSVLSQALRSLHTFTD